MLSKRHCINYQTIYLCETSIIIKPTAEIGETWNFTPSITAQVTQKTYETFFEQSDSVKTISLSNGDIIKITKKHLF